MKIVAFAAALTIACSTMTVAAPQSNAQKAGQEVKEGYKDAKQGTAKVSKKAAQKTKKGYKNTRHDVKEGYKNTRSDVNTGVDAAKENKENR